MNFNQFLTHALVATLAIGCALSAQAQTYPSKVVRIVVGGSAGSPPDVAGRAIAERLSAKYGKPFVIDNRPGANGAIAGDIVKSAPADGYTLLFTNSSLMSISPHMNKDLTWSPLADFSPIVKVGASPLVIVVPKTSPYNTLAEVIAASKRNPSKGLNVGAMGLAMGHLSILMLNQSAQAGLQVIPYNRAGDFVSDSMSGTLDVSVIGVGSVLPQIKTGEFKALAVTGGKRYEQLPSVPSVSEFYAGFEAVSWFGFFGPARMDKTVIAEINRSVNEIVREAPMKAKLLDLGTEASGGDAEELRRSVNADFKQFGDVIKAIKQ